MKWPLHHQIMKDNFNLKILLDHKSSDINKTYLFHKLFHGEKEKLDDYWLGTSNPLPNGMKKLPLTVSQWLPVLPKWSPNNMNPVQFQEDFNTLIKMSDGVGGWMGYLIPNQFLDHLVIKNYRTWSSCQKLKKKTRKSRLFPAFPLYNNSVIAIIPVILALYIKIWIRLLHKLCKRMRCFFFWKKLHSWQKIYTTAGRVTSDKAHLCSSE